MGAEMFDIVVRGPLPQMIVAEFDGFEVIADGTGSIRLVGTVPDQAKLVGLLDLLHGYDVEIESVRHVHATGDRPGRAGRAPEPS
jgi:hypothetical protein